MKKYLVFIPTIGMFALPWIHKLFYENFMYAWPNAEPYAAHTLVFTGSTAAAVFTAILFADLL